eukprot:1150813-Pelagomonas_calceolata.AAC.1
MNSHAHTHTHSLTHKHQHIGALRCYAAALEVDPKLVHVHSNMGDLWRTQGPAGSAAAAHCYSSALALQVLPLVVLHALVLERVLGVCVTWVVMFKELCLLRLPRLFGCHPKLVCVHSNMGDLWRTQGPAGSAAAAHCCSPSALAHLVLLLMAPVCVGAIICP